MKKVKEFLGKSKKRKYIIIAGVGILVVATGVMIAIPKKENYFEITKDLLSEQTGNFRYVLDVRTSERGNRNNTLLENGNLGSNTSENIVADVDKVLEEYQNSGKDFTGWTNKEGIEVVSWEYPNYKVVLSGSVESIDPLTMAMDISIATDYVSEKLTDIIVKDGVTYVNVAQLREWLLNSKDTTLVTLGRSITDNITYVEYDEKSPLELKSYFAEEDEVDSTRESDLVNVYNKFLVAYQVITSKLNINKSCMPVKDGIAGLQVSGDNAVALLKSIKNMVQGVGDLHKGIASNQYKNGLLTEEGYNQKKKETDNIITAFQELDKQINTVDLSECNLVVSGNARKYVSARQNNVMESNVAFQFDTEDKTYAVSLQMSKDDGKTKVEVPNATSTEVAELQNKDTVIDTFMNIIEYLNITSIDMRKQLETTPESIKDDLYKVFMEYINEENKGKEGYVPLTWGTVGDFIEKYRVFEETEDSSTLDKENKKLVQELLGVVSNLEVENREDEIVTTKESIKDVFVEEGTFTLYGKYDKGNSDSKLLKYNCYIMNTTDLPLTLDLVDFTVRTPDGNMYPANYEVTLKDYKSDFDMEQVVRNQIIYENRYEEVELYFAIPNGVETFDLYYKDTNLGNIVEK